MATPVLVGMDIYKPSVKLGATGTAITAAAAGTGASTALCHALSHRRVVAEAFLDVGAEGGHFAPG